MSGREEEDTVTMSTGGSDEELDEAEEVAEGDPVRELQRYLRVPVDIGSLASAFGGAYAAQEALQSLSDLLHDVDVQEHNHLPHAKHNFDQLLAMLYVQPSEENGNQLREWMKLMRISMQIRAEWPTNPAEDLRPGTPMEATDYFVFEHQSEGLIRLQWVNPLPRPEWMETGGIQCDVCMAQGLKASYQHVNEDNKRDASSFEYHRIGWDVCAPCAANHITQRRDGIREWLGSVSRGAHECLRRPCATGTAPPDLCLSVCSFRAADAGAIELEVDVIGTAGLHAAVAALPVTASSSSSATPLPACWLTTGSQILPSSNELASSKPPMDRTLTFRCASGEEFQLTAAAHVRSELKCQRRTSTGATICQSVKAITLSEKEASFNGVFKSWAHLSFPGVRAFLSNGAWLPDEDKSWILATLHSIASQAGVVHNIPLQAPLQQARPNQSQCEEPVSQSTSQKTSGAAAGYLVSPDWSELSDCMICLDRLDKDTWLRGAPVRTRCGHVFHTMCLRKFLRGHSDGTQQACPNCRTPNPLTEAAHVGGNGTLHWTLTTDAFGHAFDGEQSYRVVAVLCQDPQAVIDTAMVLSCAALQPGDAGPSRGSEQAHATGKVQL
mmetsp:Transcript_67078/g.119366  ORF Transcript_67078/g.119366 Transcript_67078/m.119366 type:complete len:611 (-) Transcript_67078:148-1980(-)